MPEQRKSATIEKALLDLANLKSIDPTLDLGDGLSIEAMTGLVEDARQAIETLNMATIAISNNRRLIQEKESAIVDLSARLRLGIGSKFGRKSEEYRIVNQTSKRSKHTKPAEQSAASGELAIAN
jgi:hypothetical protein